MYKDIYKYQDNSRNRQCRRPPQRQSALSAGSARFFLARGRRTFSCFFVSRAIDHAFLTFREYLFLLRQGFSSFSFPMPAKNDNLFLTLFYAIRGKIASKTLQQPKGAAFRLTNAQEGRYNKKTDIIRKEDIRMDYRMGIKLKTKKQIWKY